MKRVRIELWSALLSAEPWNVDPLVPAPAGLYKYVQALDSWAKGAPCEDPTIGGLIGVCQFGDSARRDFNSGRGALWSLVPPIDALQIQEAALELVGLRALTVPLVLRGRHALHHFKAEQPGGLPQILVDLEYLCGLLLSSLERGGDEPGSAAQRRLEILLVDLEVRSNPGASNNAATDHIDIPKRKKREARAKQRAEKLKEDPSPEAPLSTEALIQARAEQARRRGSFHRALIGLIVLPLLVTLYLTLPTPGGGLPSSSTYGSMPLVALVRLPGQIKVRVHASWFALPDDERDIAMMILWDQLVDETEDPGLELSVADHVNQTRGGVVAGKVWWRSH